MALAPWLQIYVAAAAFKIGGLTTYAGRFPFAVLGIACTFLVFQLVYHNFDDPVWASLAVLLLATSVVFLLFARQCRYYSLGTFLVLINLPSGKIGSIRPGQSCCSAPPWDSCFIRTISSCFRILDPWCSRRCCCTTEKSAGPGCWCSRPEPAS
jgi:hypothetical protein